MASSAGSQNPRTVDYDGISYQVVREGLAEILNPVPQSNQQDKAGEPSKEHKPQQQTVFYNPIQQFNRDLSVLAIRVFAEDFLATRRQSHGKRRQAPKKKPQKSNADEIIIDCLESNESKPNRSQKRKRDEPDADEPEDNARCRKKSKDESDVQDIVPNGNVDDIHTPKVQTAESAAQTSVNPNAIDLPLKERPQNIVNSGANVNSDGVTAGDSSGIPTGPKLRTDSGHGLLQIRVLDALSATGLRALRYATEIPAVTSVTANDLSLTATQAIHLNVSHNKQEAKITTTTGDAMQQLWKSKKSFEVIDLDPYGTAAPFLDLAVQALVNGGLLCVTCTDAGIFAAVGFPEKTFSQYGGLPMKGPHSHEAGLRLLLHTIATSAARYGLAVEPLLSLSIDFYVRVFVRIRKSPQEVKLLAGKTMIVYNCDAGCGAWSKQFLARTKESQNKNGEFMHGFSLAQAPTTIQNCAECGFKTHLAGPMWGGPIQNPHFIQKMLNALPSLSEETYQTIPRMEGMLSMARDETLSSSSSKSMEKQSNLEKTSTYARLPPHEVDHHPFFFLPSALAGTLHCQAPSTAALRGAFINLGYRVTRSHAKPGSLRTDAPWSVVWEVMREWVRQKAPLKDVKQGTAAWAIMQKDRSKSKLTQAKAELKRISETASEVDTVKTEIQALLWRLEKEQPQGSSADGPGGEKQLEQLKIVFDEKLGQQGEEKKMVRYQPNPRPNWGPMSRARGDQA